MDDKAVNEPIVPREFVIVPSFEAKWKRLGFREEDMIRLEQMLLENPKVGVVMRGTGGARKVRFAFSHCGKSGSARGIYVDFEIAAKIFLVDVYAKAEKENLTPSERNTLRNYVEVLELSLEE